MRAIFGLVLIVGLGLAGFAVYMANNYISGFEAELARAKSAQTSTVELVEVAVANRALAYGETLTPKDARLVKFPVQALPEGVFSTAADLFPNPENPQQRRVVLRQIEKNEAILAVKITKPGEEAGLTSRLDRGMRAFAIEVDVASGVSGFLRPGDRVDVYWTGESRTGGPNDRREFTKLIESSVSLIAVDQSSTNETATASIARTVTVAATPNQVAALAQAQSTGRLSLSLVGAEDDTIAAAIEVDQRDLLGIIEEAPVERIEVKEQVCTIRTRRGAEVVEIPIPCTN
ncbi:Flp pilus assembly protein CpaB [Thalassovita gelatinovora]|uniref:Flp pilus assembly protein CpaB n=1 Tax=Thalassovita gelatinovora TaxID=53501 RepID=A0A0P1F858_THAGE|nr:Flp pilus assembly protein CpaB [Thalassovita gelatinovora]QIZ80313.1 Flp pilus assembly protein CpaB [Thalassovita gelatinovora]CUH64219.1 Flp pilus assembly protein CpaB [Thalassovita gelatinovora]SEQ94895.1 pilus assembly protein CpaB [Thalassovita gelatinovora]